MLEEKFGYRLYALKDLASLDSELLQQADILQINGRVPGGIFHANRMVWVGNLNRADNALDFIRSQRERKAFLQRRQQLQESALQVEILPFTMDLYERFSQLYYRTTALKERANDDNPKGPVLGRLLAGLNVYLAGVFQDGQLLAGLSFHRKGSCLLVTLGAKERNNALRGGYGGLLELALLDYAYANQISSIVHGSRSFNPVGLVNKIGLFEFKSRYGYIAYPSEEWKSTFILRPQVVLSDLLFVSFKNQQLHYLILSDLPATELVKKYQNEEARVEVISWQEHALVVQKLLESVKSVKKESAG